MLVLMYICELIAYNSVLMILSTIYYINFCCVLEWHILGW